MYEGPWAEYILRLYNPDYLSKTVVPEQKNKDKFLPNPGSQVNDTVLTKAKVDTSDKTISTVQKSCKNCHSFKNLSCNGMRNPDTCPEYSFMPSASEETKAMWPKEMDAPYFRRRDAQRHGEK